MVYDGREIAGFAGAASAQSRAGLGSARNISATCTQQPWNPMDGLMYLLQKNASFSIDRITGILSDYQNSLMEDPQLLVSELSSLDIVQFTTVLRLLFGGRKEQIMMLEVNFSALRMSLEHSPGGNRSLFAVAREKCLSMLKEGHCVDLMGLLLSLSSGEFVQEDFIADIPTDLSDNTFRNLTAVFKDLYDMFSVTAQKAIYKWIITGLQKTSKSSRSLASWMTAENLWFLGRYMVHLTVQTVQRISLSEMRIFIHYDNATKQLDCVYDIRPGVGRAFLHRVNASGFDMANVSIAYRLGLLVCFYDNVHLLDSSDARILLHQLIKCNQLRGSLIEVQKLKSQLLAIVIRNQTLNELLGSVSDAVVGLTTSQLESLSASAVRSSMAVLQQVSGWTRSQTMILVHKYLGANKVLTSRNISELGSLISGVDAKLFYTVSTGELAQAMEGTLLQHATHLNPTQQHALLSQILRAAEVEVVLKKIPGMLFDQVPLSALLHLPGLEMDVIEDKQLTSSQAFFLYDFLSRTTPAADLIRTGQLLKGITCDRIRRMDDDSLVDNFPIFEKNFSLLSPFQLNCLAWRYLEVLEMINLPIPPILLPALPTEFVKNMSATTCKGFLVALGRMDLHLLTLYTEKREAIIRKVLQCLSNGIRDEYDVDALGKLLCHLPPTALRDQLTLAALPAALRQLQACVHLTADQRAQVRRKLVQLHGPVREWSAELIQDLGSLVTLLSREEVLVLANKYPEEVFPLATKDGPTPIPEDFLLAIFEVVRGTLDKDLPSLSSEADCFLVESPSADDIRKLSEANVYWFAKELQCISTDTFSETVELLGSVKGFNLTQLKALKSRGEQVWGPLSTWKSYHVVSLGSIALALTEKDIKELDLSSIDTMTALSQQTRWTLQQMSSLLYHFLESSNLTLGELQASDLAGLGVLLCGAQPSHVHLISPEAYGTTAAQIGTLPCPLPVLQQLKGTAEKVFGKVGTWNSFVLQEVGIVAAGMSFEEIKEMSLDLMPYLQPQAIAAIPPESFRRFSKERLQSLGPGSALAVTSAQSAQLSDEQLQALQVARDGLRESLSSHIHPAASSSQGSGTVSSGFHLHLFSGWWVCILCSTVPGKWQHL
ncbi:otoancorin isoform X2 [Scleropages formosus]|uniref:otoancorin isoform X2 n=1 Tax=Scleropages formosus TaxID=113540 RepID=UPI000878D82B|nr:otoancorin isoform X2 [Scleropages formosus]